MDEEEVEETSHDEMYQKSDEEMKSEEEVSEEDMDEKRKYLKKICLKKG